MTGHLPPRRGPFGMAPHVVAAYRPGSHPHGSLSEHSKAFRPYAASPSGRVASTMVIGGWEYARVRTVEGRWVVDREDGVPPPDLEPYADLSRALLVLDRDGWLLDPAWQPEWPYVSLRRRR